MKRSGVSQEASGRLRWKARLARALGLDGNPLRRASDRAEAWIRAGLLVVFLTAGPMAALAAGQWAAHAAAARTSAQPHAALGESASAGVVAALVTLAVAAQAGGHGEPLFLPRDESTAWAWLPLGTTDAFGCGTQK